MSGISNYFCSTSDFNSYSNVWCFHRIVLLRNMREIARELHVCFFGLQRPFSFNTCVSPIRRFGWPCAQCARSSKPSMGKSNYYDKMKWQDSIKVIITQKLHQIRNWEFLNMLNGMSTIEMIENLKIEIWPKIGWYDGSDDRRRNIPLLYRAK